MPLFRTKTIDLVAGATAVIKELSVPELKEADRVGTEDAVSLMRLLPESIVESQMKDQRDRVMERIIRYEGYDPVVLIRYGLVSWSFDEPCDDEHKAQLSATQGELAARAIFELSVLPSGEVERSSMNSGDTEFPPSLNAPTSSTPQGDD